MSQRPRILSLVPRGRTGCYLWRTVWPSEALRRHGYVADYVWFDNYQEEVAPRINSGDYNVVITPRMCFLEDYMQMAWTLTLNRAKLGWVYEVDDDLFGEPIEERFFNYSEANKIAPDLDAEERSIRLHVIAARERRVRKQTLGLVDAVTVTTQQLSDVVKPHTTAPVHVAPNAIDVQWFTNHLRQDEERILNDVPLTVGWGGGWRPGDDTEILARVWPRLARRYPSLRFVLIGWAPPEILAAVPAGQLTLFDWQDLDNYPYYLRNIDIACCSVARNEFNASKTPIKWFESTLAGSVCVGSHMLYGNVIADGYNGMLATTELEWEEQLTALIEHPDLRHALHANARRTVLEQHSVESIWPVWLNACQEALERSPRVEMVAV